MRRRVLRRHSTIYRQNMTRWDDPHAAAICDGCGKPVKHKDLHKQMRYPGEPGPSGAGSPELAANQRMSGPGGGPGGSLTPLWTGFLVCLRCLDVPNEQYRYQNLPPDPVPVVNARPDTNGTDYIETEASQPIDTESDENLVTE